jgi:hypothetical protein
MAEETHDEPVKETVTDPPNPAPEHVPDPIQKPEEHKEDGKDAIEELKARIGTLEQTVSELIPSQERDTVPTKQPWTHKRLF